jgi:hypothetical protein
MTQEQIELLKSLHYIKNYCHTHDCNTCALAQHTDGWNNCMFEEENAEVPDDWKLKPLPQEEPEKIFTVFD